MDKMHPVVTLNITFQVGRRGQLRNKINLIGFHQSFGLFSNIYIPINDLF